MALFDIHRPYGPAQGVAGRIAHVATTLYSAVAEWDDVRRTRAALSKLSSHELDDLGLTRADLDKIGRRR